MLSIDMYILSIDMYLWCVLYPEVDVRIVAGNLKTEKRSCCVGGCALPCCVLLRSESSLDENEKLPPRTT